MTALASSARPRPPLPAHGARGIVRASAPVRYAVRVQDGRARLARPVMTGVLAGDSMTGGRHALMLRMRLRVWVTRLSARSGRLWKVRNRR